MIEIIVNNVSLPIEGQKITRETESTLFNREADALDFTYPFEVALTDEVIVALGHPHELANKELGMSYPARLVVDGVVSYAVTLKILKVSLKKKTATVNIVGDYGSLAKVFGEKKLTDLHLDGTRTIGAADPANEATFTVSGVPGFTYNVIYTPCTTWQHMNDVLNGFTNADYTFLPGMDTGEVDEELKPDYGTWIRDRGVLLNAYFGRGGHGLRHVDPVKDFITAMTKPDDGAWPRKFWVPYFKFLYVFKKCWEEFGFTITGDFLSDPGAKRVLLYNNYSIDSCYVAHEPLKTTIRHEAFTIQPQNHMPDMKVMDFLLETAKPYNLQYHVDFAAKKVEVVFVQTDNGSLPVVDLSHLAEPDPDISTEEAAYRNGYEFAFEWDAADSASGDTLPQDYMGASHIAPLWPQMQGYKTSNEDGLQKISTKLVPMQSGVATFVFAGQPMMEKLYNPVVISEMGVSGENLLGWDKESRRFTLVSVPRTDMQPHIINNNGMLDYNYNPGGFGTDPGGIYPAYLPTATSTNIDPTTGWHMGGDDLVWKTAEMRGFYDLRWKAFAKLLKKAPQMEYTVLMDANTYGRYDLRRCIIKIEGLHYLLKKSSIVMPFPELAKLTLVRI